MPTTTPAAPKLGRAMTAAILCLAAVVTAQDRTLERFDVGEHYRVVADVALPPGSASLEATEGAEGSILYTGSDFQEDPFLMTRQRYGDHTISLEFMVPPGSQASVYVQARYELKLSDSAGSDTIGADTAGAISGGFNRDVDQPFPAIPPLVNAARPPGEWQTLRIRFRGVRYDAAHNKTDKACFLEVELNGQIAQRDMPVDYVSPGSHWEWEAVTGPFGLLGSKGEIAIRNVSIDHANFDAVTVPERGESSNIDALIDQVALGAEAFHAMGCIECHTTVKNDASLKTGPNLYGLFTRQTRKREIAEGGADRRFLVDVDRGYFLRSLRQPAAELAIAESGPNQGKAYLPVMPPYAPEIISDAKADAIWRYLGTLNDLDQQGPTVVLVEKSGPKQYDPLADTMQALVGPRVRIQRGPMEGVSGRSVHVGLPNGINYTFDTRTLAIERLWQGGFLDGSGEWQNRGGYGFAPGYASKEIDLGPNSSLVAPLLPSGATVDFSFKEAIFEDWDTIEASLNSPIDHRDRLAQIGADFLGYELPSNDPTSPPAFRYRIGQNELAIATAIAADGSVTIELSGRAATEQRFSVNTHALSDLKVSAGSIGADGVWTLPAAASIEARLEGKLMVASQVWRPQPVAFDYLRQPLRIEPTEATLPAGYASEQFLPPEDNFGRPLLFESTALAVAPDGTIVVGTRTSGIWRIVEGKWRLFAEGLFDCLGLVIEDDAGLQIVAGQKPELTRISDTDGDGIADRYETLTDDFSFHGNYHSYMHGPVRDAAGNYYFNLNLLHTDKAIHKAGGLYMGTSGGYRGWTIQVTPDGEFVPWANGLRSPAGLALAPDGRLWYSENQGEFVGTSKLFILEEGKFYGHPSGLVDLPGQSPDSPAIQWEAVAGTRERAVVLFPHNRVANSPGNPAWDTTDGRFGPFAGQIFIGDQTQSKLLRVVTDVVDGVTQGAVLPFGSNLQSGIMRPVFLPDGSLLIGQTGRGWQAWGGKVASLQRLTWDGVTVPAALRGVYATDSGFRIELTQPLAADATAESIASAVTIKSWLYRDAPDYGSPEIDPIDESIAELIIAPDRRSIEARLAPQAYESVPNQTARVYHLAIGSGGLFGGTETQVLEAYYTRWNPVAAE